MQRFLILFIFVFLFACSGQSKEELLQEGNQLRDQANFRGAIVLYKNALEKDANFLAARTQLAEVYLLSGSFDKAENEFKKVLHQDPSATQILLKLATINIQLKKPEAALLELDKFHSSSPETAESLTLYGRAHGSSGDLKSAENLFNKAIQLEPDAIQPKLNLAKVFLQRQATEPARKLLLEIIEQDKSFTQAYYLLASVESRDGKREEALQVYQDLIQVDAKQLQAHYMAGLLLLDLNRLEEAEKTIDGLLTTFVDRPEGHRLKGMLLYRQGKYEDAIHSFETSLKTQQHLLAYFFLGLSHYSQDQLELALNQFQKALDLEPSFERARILVSMTLLKQKRIDDAIIEIQKVLRANPNNAYAHNILGSALLATGQYDAGMAELEKATDIDPNLADAHLKRGMFHLAKGQGTEGEADLIKAVAASPEVLNSRLLLVTHYLRQKNYSAVIETLEAGMNGSAEDALLNNYLAAAYFSQKKPEQALAALRKAQIANPDYLTPYFNIASYYASNSEYKKAQVEYDAVLVRDAKNVKALLGKAAIHSLQGQTSALEAVYLQLEETGVEDGFVAATSYQAKQKNYAVAVKIVDRGLAVHSASAPLLELKGRLHQQQNQLHEAESAYIGLSGVSPEKGGQLLLSFYVVTQQLPKAEQLVADLLKTSAGKDYPYLLASGFSLNQKQPEKAIQLLQQGIATVASKLRLQMQLANIYQSTGKMQQAEQAYQRIIEEAPRFAPAYTSLGYLKELVGNKGRALELYRSALKYDPNNIAALNNLAYLLTDNFGQEKEALDLAMSAYRAQPNDPRIMDTLGYILLKNKKTEDALTLLTSAADLLPDAPAVKLHLAMAYVEKKRTVAAQELLEQVIAKGSADDIKQAKELLKSL